MDEKKKRELYHQYETELFSIDNKSKINTPPYWWENSADAVFLTIYDEEIVGFVIVGYGKFIDPDVKSEICEIYLTPSHRSNINFKQLLNKAFPYLKSPWGFQILESNHRAKLLFEYSLKKSTMNFTKKSSQDGIMKVYKYRVFHEFIP